MNNDQDMAAYQSLLKAHDWYWRFSDDASVCRSARLQEEVLEQLSKKSTDHKKLWEAWNAYISATITGSESKPVEPTWPPQDAVQAVEEKPAKLKIPVGISGNSFILSRQMAIDFLEANRMEAESLKATVEKYATISPSTRTKIIHLSGPGGADCLFEYCDMPRRAGEAFNPVINMRDRRVCAARVSVPGQTSYFCTRAQALAWVLLWKHRGLL